MIEKNIFRPLPNVKKSNLAFSETGIEQEEEVDPSWPHLQGIYEFFLSLIINEAADVKSLKVYVTPQFVQEFLELFDSEESVERDYLKNILHKLYAKVRKATITIHTAAGAPTKNDQESDKRVLLRPNPRKPQVQRSRRAARHSGKVRFQILTFFYQHYFWVRCAAARGARYLL